MSNAQRIGARGSEWRKWDLQVHTPASHLNNQFGANWDVYVQKLFRTLIAKEIAVVGLTDYFTIEGYKKIKTEYLDAPKKMASLFTAEEISKIDQIAIFPNIEFRLNKLVGPNRINSHVILSDEIAVKDIEEHFLHDLTFTNQAQPQAGAEKFKLKTDNLRALGERLIKEHQSFQGKDPLYVGMMNAVVDDDLIFDALKDPRFKGKFLFCVVADEDLSKISWNSQDHLTRKVLIQKSDALFSGNPSTRNWALGRPPQYKDGEASFRQEFKTLKPCIHGSDCHAYDEIGHPCARRGKQGHDCIKAPQDCELRFCWIKADPTFEGLRQIVHEPSERVFIGASPPEYHDRARVISSVSISAANGWFANDTVPLNAGMVAIIGQKGSGKSALADLVAFAAGSWDQDDEGSFLSRAGDHLSGMEITLEWADGSLSKATIGEESYFNEEVRYLSQNYVERICGRDGLTKDLVREIENVVFRYLDPTDTLNASDFSELRTLKTQGTREEGNRLRDELSSIIREECELRDLIAKRPEKEARIKTLTDERVALEKQTPKATTQAEAKVQEQLQEKRVALTKLQQGVATQKQILQRVSDIRTRTAAFKSQMDRFYDQLRPSLHGLGVPPSEWEKFKPVFKGDVTPVLTGRETAITAAIAQVEGSDPPADGTIKKIQLEIDELAKKDSADKARQERTKQIQTRIAAIGAEIERLAAEVKSLDESGKPKLDRLVSERLAAYIAYFENLKSEEKALQALYEPIRQRLSDQALLKGKELEFSVRWAADISTWLERGESLFDQRRTLPYGTFEKLSAAARKLLLPAWTSGDPKKIESTFQKFMEEFRRPDLPWKNFIRSGVTAQVVLTWLYSVDHISLEYGLKFDGADLESLSPGTKGIVLLILYLGLDIDDTRPLVVDQPDENLDNESIYSLLTPYFRLAKERRQIIVITHNPNLVVNSDSEQIVIATGEKQGDGMPLITYGFGSLEHDRPRETGTRQQVCRILEGGDDAFRKRESRYAIPER